MTVGVIWMIIYSVLCSVKGVAVQLNFPDPAWIFSGHGLLILVCMSCIVFSQFLMYN